MRHERTICEFRGLIGYKSKIAMWHCPCCKTTFQSGSENTKEMTCVGHG
jgi:lipopolysaccharide biosynthesis regulator YciM